MPLYEYECDSCAERFEVIQKFSDAPVETCAQCGKGPVRRLLSSPAIQFKGSGWYITDYAQKGKTGNTGKSEKTESGGTSNSADTSKNAETGKGESKPEKKSTAPASSATSTPSKS